MLIRVDEQRDGTVRVTAPDGMVKVCAGDSAEAIGGAVLEFLRDPQQPEESFVPPPDPDRVEAQVGQAVSDLNEKIGQFVAEHGSQLGRNLLDALRGMSVHGDKKGEE